MKKQGAGFPGHNPGKLPAKLDPHEGPHGGTRLPVVAIIPRFFFPATSDPDRRKRYFPHARVKENHAQNSPKGSEAGGVYGNREKSLFFIYITSLFTQKDNSLPLGNYLESCGIISRTSEIAPGNFQADSPIIPTRKSLRIFQTHPQSDRLCRCLADLRCHQFARQERL